MQRNPQYDTKPPIASLDFSDHLRQQYWNCENSFAIFQAISAEGTFVSLVSWERFDANVQILLSSIKGVPTLAEELTFKKDIAPLVKRMKGKSNGSDFEACTHGEGYLVHCDCSEQEIKEDPSSLTIWTAITALFHRKNIFKEAQITYGGHI